VAGSKMRDGKEGEKRSDTLGTFLFMSSKGGEKKSKSPPSHVGRTASEEKASPSPPSILSAEKKKKENGCGRHKGGEGRG